MHKTGSTSIQRALYDCRDKLRDKGWYLFTQTAPNRVSSIGNANSWVEFKGHGPSFSAFLNPNIYEELANIGSNVILSAEELAWINSESEIQSIYSSLSSIFEEIKIVVYLRRQDKHLLSHYHQGFKNPNSTARRFYGSDLNVFPEFKPYYNEYLDYSRKLRLWESKFGNDSFIVRFFEKDLLIDFDPVADFKSPRVCNLDIDILNGETVNESFNLIQSIISNSIYKVRKDLWFELGQPKFIKKPHFSDGKTPKIDKETSDELLTHFYKSNLKLKDFGLQVPETWLVEKGKGYKKSLRVEIDIEQYEKAVEALVFYMDNLRVIDFIKLKLKKWLKKIQR